MDKNLISVAGILDKNDVGEIYIILNNCSGNEVKIQAFQPLAQLVPYRVPNPILFCLEELTLEEFKKLKSERGTKGFGEATKQFQQGSK